MLPLLFKRLYLNLPGPKQARVRQMFAQINHREPIYSLKK